LGEPPELTELKQFHLTAFGALILAKKSTPKKLGQNHHLRASGVGG
jgi:hypothetical protein